MKILLLTQVLPYPPDSGPKVKTWNVLKYLAQNHELTLVSFVRGDQSAEIAHLKTICHAVHTVPIERKAVDDMGYLLKSVLSNQPFLMVRDDRAAMRQLLAQLCAQTQFDIAHADQLNMAQYAEQVPGAAKILDAHNALWLLYKRLADTLGLGPQKLIYSRDWRLLKKYEGRICREFEGILAVSQEDKTALEEAMGQAREMTVIPIAVDLDELPLIERNPDADHILHIGTMYWPPNIDAVNWFIDEVLPIIHQSRPQTIFDIVGLRPPQELVERGQQDPRLNVTGYVEDTEPYYQKAGAFIVPVRAGGGMRVKILNALAQGMPLVTTTLGCEGIAVTHEKDVLIADTPQAFAEAVLRLLTDRALAEQLGRRGRELIRTTYDYRAACQPIDDLYRQVKG
ncbi:MAG: glycosyltransferase [Anaerolineae bacterium]|nr:glycosyltransferase [Anaerolineae bacterium]